MTAKQREISHTRFDFRLGYFHPRRPRIFQSLHVKFFGFLKIIEFGIGVGKAVVAHRQFGNVAEFDKSLARRKIVFFSLSFVALPRDNIAEIFFDFSGGEFVAEFFKNFQSIFSRFNRFAVFSEHCERDEFGNLRLRGIVCFCRFQKTVFSKNRDF